MTEPNISPLARRLAEENNVDWRALPGSGAEGKVVERDVLDYLARVMAGEEALDPTPEPVPEGMEAWPEEDAAPAPVPTTASSHNLDELQRGLAASSRASAAATAEAPAVAAPEFEPDHASEVETDDGISEDIFLFDDDFDEDADPGTDAVAVASAGPAAEAATGATDAERDTLEDDVLLLTDPGVSDDTAADDFGAAEVGPDVFGDDFFVDEPHAGADDGASDGTDDGADAWSADDLEPAVAAATASEDEALTEETGDEIDPVLSGEFEIPDYDERDAPDLFLSESARPAPDVADDEADAVVTSEPAAFEPEAADPDDAGLEPIATAEGDERDERGEGDEGFDPDEVDDLFVAGAQPEAVDAPDDADEVFVEEEGPPAEPTPAPAHAGAEPTDFADVDAPEPVFADSGTGAARSDAAEPWLEDVAADASDPVASEPVATEPVAIEPIATEPVDAEPVAEPIAAESAATEPEAAPDEIAPEPEVADEPIATEPIAVEPATDETPVAADEDETFEVEPVAAESADPAGDESEAPEPEPVAGEPAADEVETLDAAEVATDAEAPVDSVPLAPVAATVDAVVDAADETRPAPESDAAAPLPLVSYGNLLRRHHDLTALAEAQLAVARELGEEDPIAPSAFLLRAAAKALAAEPLPGGSSVAVAVISGGFGVREVPDARRRPFTELLELTRDGSGLDAVADGVALVVADLSALEVDEAVLDVGAPVLTLGRILYDNQRGSYRSTLSLSGDVAPDVGARLLARVAELLDAPVRLVI